MYKKAKAENRPKTFDEFKKFIEAESRYPWWSRCEYEIMLRGWPNEATCEKIDVHKQVMMNIDAIAEILMKELKV